MGVFEQANYRLASSEGNDPALPNGRVGQGTRIRLGVEVQGGPPAGAPPAIGVG